MSVWKVWPWATVITVTTAGEETVLLAEDRTGEAAVLRLGAEVVKPRDPDNADEARREDARLADSDWDAKIEDVRLPLAD